MEFISRVKAPLDVALDAFELSEGYSTDVDAAEEIAEIKHPKEAAGGRFRGFAKVI